MLANILSYVPKRDMVYNVTKASHVLKFATTSAHVWKNVYLSGFKPWVTNVMIKAMDKNASLIQSIRINSYNMFKSRSAFVNALEKMVNLTKFVSPNQTSQTNFSFLKKNNKIPHFGHFMLLLCKFWYFISSTHVLP